MSDIERTHKLTRGCRRRSLSPPQMMIDGRDEARTLLHHIRRDSRSRRLPLADNVWLGEFYLL